MTAIAIVKILAVFFTAIVLLASLISMAIGRIIDSPSITEIGFQVFLVSLTLFFVAIVFSFIF